jgi:hypothetical protein
VISRSEHASSEKLPHRCRACRHPLTKAKILDGGNLVIGEIKLQALRSFMAGIIGQHLGNIAVATVFESSLIIASSARQVGMAGSFP